VFRKGEGNSSEVVSYQVRRAGNICNFYEWQRDKYSPSNREREQLGPYLGEPEVFVWITWISKELAEKSQQHEVIFW